MRMLVGVALAAGVVACSSGGDAAEERGDDPQRSSGPLDGTGREAYVMAFEETARDPVSGEPTEEFSCVAEAIVDAVGVEQLRDVATPREIAAAANGGGASLAGLGVEVGAARADAIYAGIEECGDPAEMFVASVPGPQLSGPVADCFTAGLDDALVREIVMTQLVEGGDALAEKPEITGQLTAIGRSCAAQS